MRAAVRYLFLSWVAAFLAAPLVVITGVSLNDSARMLFPPHPVSLIWYRTFLGDADWMSAFGRSVLIAAWSSVTAVAIALPVAYAAWKYRSRLAGVLQTIARLSFLLPSIVVAIVFLVFWSALRHAGRIEDTIIAHAMVFVTLPLTTIAMGLRAVDRSLLDAARTMGARESDLVRTVIRPIVLPYIVCGAVFVFILSLNEYIIAYMVAGFEVVTLPIKVFNNLRMGFEPTMCVGAVLFMLLGIVAFGLIGLVGDLPRLLGGRR